MQINLDDLTNGDIAKIEEVTGRALEDLILNGKMSHIFKCAVTWLHLLKTNPAIAWEEVLNGTIDFFDNIEVVDDTPKG